MRRYLINLSGIVQGVGFRPYVYRKAKEYNVCGWVNNSGANVIIDAEGDKTALKLFVLDVVKRPPLPASVEKTEILKKEPVGYEYFKIKHSRMKSSRIKRISPDMGVCEKCMKEVNDPYSRRYRYAFTSCTECGPRYSIIKSLSYDRCNTTMKDFIMCDECREEYENPERRRFHTQLNCCNVCGPTYTLINDEGTEIESDDIIKKTAMLIIAGSILAIKGIGGFHLCCNAKNESAIKKLRHRKGRPDKPLALMMKDVDIVHKYCEVTNDELKVLTNQRRPIVLLNGKQTCQLPDNIAPWQKRLGVMLPFLPIHHLLFENNLEVLVTTSGNISGSHIQYENQGAFNNLKKIADYFLMHNRDIYNPLDDSVVKLIGKREMVSRMARGYVPYVQKLDTKCDILALGAQQKSTFAVSSNGYMYLSQYIGDLNDMDSCSLYKQAIGKLTYLIESSPNVYAHDLNPGYYSTQYAKERQGIRIPVQHHHAHMASCMVEHKLYGQVIGVIFDGTGLGADGTVWGGEFFVGDRKSYIRVGNLKPVLLQGADTAVKEPWKTAVSYLWSLGYDAGEYLLKIDRLDIDIIEQALSSNLNCHWSSSMGRLFDCISAIIGVRQHISYDAQAAVELECILDSTVDNEYVYIIEKKDDALVLDYKDIISGVLTDIKNNRPQSYISAKFHNTVSSVVVDVVIRVRDKFELNNVVLSGGVFENIYLLESVSRRLRENDFTVYYNEQIPVNDSGISVGQLAIADETVRGC